MPRIGLQRGCRTARERPSAVAYPRAMPGILPSALPPIARAAWAALHDRLLDLLGDRLVAVWAHGGTTSGSTPGHVGDLDTHVIVTGRPDEETIRSIEEAHATIADAHGIEWDAWYILEADARRSEAPSHAWTGGRRDTSWAIHRAHWLAGGFVTLYGPDPDDIVAAPAWDEVRAELDRELEHLERHVVEGDTDPYEATYAVLTGSRILHALATGNVAVSKQAAGRWALEQLPDRWHAALRAALRTYRHEPSRDDTDLLAAEMAPFVSFVRGHLAPSSERPPGTLPRWSGY